MGRKRLAAEQIVTKLRQIEVLQGQGKTIAMACKEAGTMEQNYYCWRKEYGGLGVDQANDHIGAELLYSAFPAAKTLIADKGYGSDEFRDALQAKEINACIPPKINRRRAIMFDKRHKNDTMTT